jgi:membrane protein
MAWRRRVRTVSGEMIAGFGEQHLWTYASAIAFRTLVALVPIVLLVLALLEIFGLEDFWRDSIAPAIQGHVTPPAFRAIDYSAQKIFARSTVGLMAFAGALVVWDMTWAVATVREALNEIHDAEDRRSWKRRMLVSVALAVAVIVCTVGSALVVILGARPEGVLHFVFGIGRWPVAIVLLGLAVGLLVRYAPAQKPEVGWASAGSGLVVGSWLIATIAFRWWVTSVANFKTAVGSLTVFLLLTAYVFVSVAIFLLGVQLDELLRKDVRRG